MGEGVFPEVTRDVDGAVDASTNVGDPQGLVVIWFCHGEVCSARLLE